MSDELHDTAPEREIATDLIRRGLLVGPVLVALCGLVWGWEGVASASLALGLGLLLRR